jgi:hypothetical protein
MPSLSISIDQILKELCLDTYITSGKELTEITEKCKNVLSAQSDKTFDRFEQIEQTLNFIKTIWSKYDCKEIADIYSSFVKIEEALYGLEREEDLGNRYRDHFVHMFNCYIFGIRIISFILSAFPEDKAKNIFKVENECLKEIGLPFGSNYTYKQRLFYLWTIISTFHDIAIPFQHLASIGKGINKFIQEFGWIFTDAKITMKNYDSSQLFYYFNLLSSLYGGNFEIIDNGRKYNKSDKPHYYITKILGREFDRRDHGVLSGFFMWKTIEEIFLIGRSIKYPLNINEFNLYTEYILEQDIARAALAISLHSIKADSKNSAYPKIFPIDFKDLPFTFLLILSDELQEYFRWEGVSLKKEMKFSYHPIIECETNESDLSIKITVKFSLDSKNADNIIRQAKDLLGDNNGSIKIDNAVEVIAKSLQENLENKLLLGDHFKLQLNIYEDWGRTLYSREYKSRRLDNN